MLSAIPSDILALVSLIVLDEKLDCSWSALTDPLIDVGRIGLVVTTLERLAHSNTSLKCLSAEVCCLGEAFLAPCRNISKVGVLYEDKAASERTGDLTLDNDTLGVRWIWEILWSFCV